MGAKWKMQQENPQKLRCTGYERGGTPVPLSQYIRPQSMGLLLGSRRGDNFYSSAMG